MRYALPVAFVVLVAAGALHAVETTYKVQQLVPPDVAADQFGTAVAAGDGIIAVGAYLSDVNGKDSGAVYLYRKVGTEWEPFPGMPLHQGAGEWFGFDVAVHGTQLVVGAPDPTGGPGAAYVYDLTRGTVMKLGAPGARDGDEVGSAVAIDGEYIAVGARSADGRAGRVDVFSSAGKHQQTLVANPRAEKAEFGGSLALRGGRLVVGAPSPYSSSHSPGAAYLFNLPGSSPTALVPSVVPEKGSAFGYAVAIGDQGIIVGAPLAGGTSKSGKVFLFTGADVKSLREGDQAGVAVAADKGLIVVGAVAAQKGRGSAYLCGGTPCAPLPLPLSANGFGFGTAVYGETIAVGAFKEKRGAVYVFEPETVAKPTFRFDKTRPIRGKEGETISVPVILETDHALAQSAKATVSMASVNGSGDIEISTAEVEFPENSEKGATQSARVTLLADCLSEGEETFRLDLADASDTQKKTLDTLVIKVQDGDNVARIERTLLLPLVTDDSGEEEVFHVRLMCQPAAEVTVTLTSTDPAEGKVVAPSSSVVRFLPENWNEFQAVTIRGQADGDADCADEPYQITFTLSSADPSYNGVFGPALDFVNEEDEGACLSVTAEAAVCADQDGTILYTFTIENPGSRLEDLAGPELFDTLPDQVKVVAATADFGVATVDYAGNSVAWNGSIPSEDTVTIQVLAALEPGVNPGTEVKDQDNQFRYGTDGKGPEAAFTVGDPEDACPIP